MIYRSVSSAVVSALAAESKNSIKGQSWQKLYDPTGENVGDIGGYVSDSGQRFDRNQVDYWIAARLHRLLSPRHWNVLVAKYSTHKARKVEAIGKLKPMVSTPASQLFLYKAVTAWAIPKLSGARRKQVNVASLDVPPGTPAWRREAMMSAAASADKVARRAADSGGADMIILPDSFYDMNGWDLDAHPESTRRRWRSGINKTLDEMVTEAFQHAELILRAEGVLDEEAA